MVRVVDGDDRDRMQTFPALSALDGFVHALTLRDRSVDVTGDKEVDLPRLRGHFDRVLARLGYDWGSLVTGEQVHGSEIAIASPGAAGGAPLAGVDGLICRGDDMILGVYVADCCAVYLADAETGAFGVVHSGRKGTELGIVPRAIEEMRAAWGIAPGGLLVQLSPCIRPPDYEVDIAAEIRRQCADAGVPANRIHDEGISTASDLERYYSYRMEKGKTGRMLALLGRKGDGGQGS